MKGYIYIIKNSINEKVYIGQTARTIEARWSQHKASALRGDTQGIILYNAIRKYGVNNFYVSLLEETEIENLNERERYWIKYYNSKTPNGYNVREGGDDPGRKEVYQIDKETNKIIKVYSCAMDAAEENHLDLSHLTKVCRHKENSCGGYKWSYSDNYNETLIENIQIQEKNYPICQIDINTGKLIKIWDSVQQASKTLNIDPTSIFHCFSGRYNNAGGFCWCKEKDFDNYTFKPKFKKVVQIDKNNNIIKIWNSAQEAADFLNKKANTIRAAARGKTKTAYGYKWKYEENMEDDKSKN